MIINKLSEPSTRQCHSEDRPGPVGWLCGANCIDCSYVHVYICSSISPGCIFFVLCDQFFMPYFVYIYFVRMFGVQMKSVVGWEGTYFVNLSQLYESYWNRVWEGQYTHLEL